MNPINKFFRRSHHGAALIISMIFVLIFSALAVSLASLSGTNMQLASNQHKGNSALAAALSGLECGKYIVAADVLAETHPFPSTGYNYVTSDEAEATWNTLCARVQAQPWVSGQATAGTNEIITPAINFGSTNTDFAIRFYRYDSNPYIIKLQSTGTHGDVTKQIHLAMEITKNSEVLEYAIAGRGRMWLTGTSTIHGDIFSAWNRPEISPFNMTSDSTVLGTINTVLTQEQIAAEDYQLETLDENGNPMFDEEGNRIYSPEDEIQADHEGINYDQPYDEDLMPGMDIDDYDTDSYNSGITDIPECPSSDRVIEYFPHAAGDYSQSKSWSSKKLNRHVYEGQHFNNVYLPDDRNALFRNCIFDGVLYIDCNKSGENNYNNVRFENCTFNGTIVTDVPQKLKWKNNCLYFTGEATFENTSGIEEATILAPHFNVNLGNTNPEQGDNNILTGAIIGGIVDVRGNAQINGTIISMCDTSQWSSGYVTNIGATLGDGGSETTEPGDVGVIDITPDEDKMLPSGITTPIVITALPDTYSEGF